MSRFTLRIHAVTPLLFRDARPFSDGSGESRATSLPLPPPSAIAGLVRTHVGNELGWDWQDPATIEMALSIHVVRYVVERGSGGARAWVLPAPRTALVHEVTAGAYDVMRMTPGPLPSGSGHDMPAGLEPLIVTSELKPSRGFSLWDNIDVQRWLAGDHVVPADIAEPPIDERVHIALEPGRRVVQDGMLFTAQYRAWEQGDNSNLGSHRRWALVVTVDTDQALRLGEGVARFGAEQRPVVITTTAGDSKPNPPESRLVSAVTATHRVTLMLATPALFAGGWRPGWADSPDAIHPSLAGARLVSAAVGRPETVAGWSHALGKRGPKATRWAAAAGATYFFELRRPLTTDEVRELWLTSVSDDPTDRRDGYGLALWGVWNQ